MQNIKISLAMPEKLFGRIQGKCNKFEKFKNEMNRVNVL